MAADGRLDDLRRRMQSELFEHSILVEKLNRVRANLEASAVYQPSQPQSNSEPLGLLGPSSFHTTAKDLGLY